MECNSSNDLIEVGKIESFLLKMPQVECPVIHHFGPSIYIREVTLQAGSIVIGHVQKYEHLNIMLSGKVALLNDDNSVKILEAPMIFVGKPGRKIGYILETCVWQNVYATNETDVQKLEDHFLIKSEAFKINEESLKKIDFLERERDRDDFHLMLKQFGFNEETVRMQSENLEDQIEMPLGFKNRLTIRDSSIEGKGAFLSSTLLENEIIAPARINKMRTQAGRYVNHSANPNAKFIKDSNSDIWLVSIKKINGCVGGNHGDEITVDYRQALLLSEITMKNEVLK